MVSENYGGEIDYFYLYFDDSFCLRFFVRKKETAMGISIDALSKPNSEYVRAVNEWVI